MSASLRSVCTSRRRFLSVGALAVLALSGCATIKQQDKVNQLENQVKLFVKSIRWGDFDVAGSMVRRRDASQSDAPDASKYRGVRVTSDKYALRAANPESDEAIMAATFDYHSANSASIKTVDYTAVWWYDPTPRLGLSMGSCLISSDLAEVTA